MTSWGRSNKPISSSPAPNEDTTSGLNMCDPAPVCVCVCVFVYRQEHICVYINYVSGGNFLSVASGDRSINSCAGVSGSDDRNLVCIFCAAFKHTHTHTHTPSSFTGKLSVMFEGWEQYNSPSHTYIHTHTFGSPQCKVLHRQFYCCQWPRVAELWSVVLLAFVYQPLTMLLKTIFFTWGHTTSVVLSPSIKVATPTCLSSLCPHSCSFFIRDTAHRVPFTSILLK